MTWPSFVEVMQFKPWPRPDWEWPKLQAHRGFWVEGERENSLGSLAKAKEKGFGMCEIDVRLSRDQVPVLAHDKDLRRVAGQNLKVKHLSAKQLGDLGFPTLEEVLQTKHRPAKINVEIKNDERLDSLLEKNVGRVLESSGRAEDVVISAFNPLSLNYFARHAPDIPRALLIELDQHQNLSYWRLIGNCVAQAHMVNWPHQLLNEALVRFLRSSGVPVATWTVNDYRRGRQLLEWGVQSLITDRIMPDRLS